jgi:hypothetical protein
MHIENRQKSEKYLSDNFKHILIIIIAYYEIVIAFNECASRVF